MKAAYIHLEKLQRRDALRWRVANVSGWRVLLQQVGMVAPILVNAQTGNILTAPGMLEALQAAHSAGDAAPHGIILDGARWLVPVASVSIDPAHEALVLLALTGGIDRGLTPGLMDDSAIEVLLEVAERNFALLPATGITSEDFQLVLDALAGAGDAPTPTPAQPDYDIPMLDQMMQGDVITPVLKWGTVKRGTPFEGLIHFYTDDRKFRAVLNNPDVVKCKTAIELNITTRFDTPYAVGLNIIYQKRTIARRWQAAGVGVIVDMNVDRKFFEANLIGVPTGWRVYANRGYHHDVEHLLEAYALARRHAGRDDITYIVYGGGKKVIDVCQQNGWIWLREHQAEVRGLYSDVPINR